MMRLLRALPIAALLALASFGMAGPQAASATTTCPPSPTPGSTVHGDLEVVSGVPCVLDHVTVNGSVTVDPNGQLYLQNGAVVTGGISVASRGLLQVAFGSKVGGAVTLDRAEDAIIASSTVSHGLSGSVDTVFIASSTVNGGVSTRDTRREFNLCGSKVTGSVQVSGGGALRIGDPPSDTIETTVIAQNTGQEQTYTCDGNSITGSLTVQGGRGSIEANKISGPGAALTVTNARVELEGNTVSGGATCTGDSFSSPDNDTPAPSNTYSGPNNGCP